MNAAPKKRDTREWTWAEGAARLRSDTLPRRIPGDDRIREPSRLERSARMRGARLLEPFPRLPPE